MNLNVRVITDPGEALGLLPLVERTIEDATEEYRDRPLPDGVAHGFLGRTLVGPEGLLLVAETNEAAGGSHGEGGHTVAILGTVADTDPLTGAVTPFLGILHVDPKWRHRGVARGVLGEARKILLERGLKALGARAAHNDDAIIAMGERWGFLRQWEGLVLD